MNPARPGLHAEPAALPPPPWAAVKALFEALLDLPEAERRLRLQQPQVDRALAAEVAALLAQHEAECRSGEPFLAQAPTLAVARPQADRRGQRLGPWQLDEPLGSGGMAEVWAAHRADGAYAAQVAIKLLRPGMDNAAVLARFASEQRALARLEHPHIARLIDAARDADGVPFFVMERVDGLPLTQACAGRPLAERLGLFLQLADAVAFAHRALLVHRDLKPANVLVTAQGQVKLLDFGIAKALDLLEDADAALTQAGERPLTPHYASPEQVRGEPVGTATDVYALGVLLFEVLTGRRPYATAGENARQVLQAVLEAAPPRPSSLLPAGDPLARALRGDLDRVVLKALAKEPGQRHGSVDALAADLRAWQAGRPVSASAPRPGYLLARFVARHRVPVAMAATALLALLAALAALLHQVHETQAAQALAERRFAQARGLAQRLLFQHHDQIVNLAGALPAREALLADAQRYLATLGAEVGDDAALARELAETHFRIAALQGETFSPSQERLDAAAANLDQALRLQPLYLRRTDVDPAALPAALDMWMSRSLLHTRSGRPLQAVQALEQAEPLAERMQQALGATPAVLARRATLQGRLGLAKGGGAALAQLGRLDEAGQHFVRSNALFEAAVAAEPANPEWQHQLAWALGNHQGWLLLQARWPEAAAMAERALALRRAAAAARPDDHHLRYQAVVYQLRLASSKAYTGEHALAQRLLDEVEATTQAMAAAEPANRALQRDRAVLQVVRGRAATLAGRPVDALRHLAEALRTLPPARGDDFLLSYWQSEAHLGRARLLLAHNPAQALDEADAALAVALATPDDPSNASRRWAVAQAQGERARALRGLGRADQAAQASAAARQAWGGAVPPQFRALALVDADRGHDQDQDPKRQSNAHLRSVKK